MNTRDITKKKPRSLNSPDSSSSAETAPSKPPKDVLGLGKYLVRELGFEDGVDTLGRWMSHHVAELIDMAENGATASKRSKASKKAIDMILKIWEHRRLLPGKAYPLAPYKDVLTVLHRLRPDNNPFRYYNSHHNNAKRDQLAAILFNHLTRLIIALLLMKIPSDAISASADSTAVEALNNEEQQISMAIQQWFELLTPPSGSSGRKRKTKKDSNESEINLNEVAVQLIDGISTSLAELRNEFQAGEETSNES